MFPSFNILKTETFPAPSIKFSRHFSMTARLRRHLFPRHGGVIAPNAVKISEGDK